MLLVLFALPFFGCQSNTPDPRDLMKSSVSQEKRLGQLQSLGGAFTSTQATHLLRMADGKNLYLKSDKIDLNNEKFLSKEIEVMGEILRTKDGNQVMSVVSIDILDQENAQVEGLPVWEDFQSEKLALSLKYRDDFTVTESSDGLIIRRDKKALDENSIVPDEVNVPLSDALTEPVSEISIQLLSSSSDDFTQIMGVESLGADDILAGGYTRSKITQKALDAYKKVEAVSQSTVYFTMNSNGIYKISLNMVTEEKDKVGFQNMFYDILASIDFANVAVDTEESDDLSPIQKEGAINNEVLFEATENTVEDGEENIVVTNEEIAGFTTFQSESAGFSVQYPKSYYFGAVASKASDAQRGYEFGSEPLEESPGDIVLEVLNGDVPSGSKVEINGKSMTKVSSGTKVMLYTEIEGKVFRMTGTSAKEAVMRQMMSTIQ